MWYPGILYISYSDIRDGTAGIWHGSSGSIFYWQEGNIDADPCFVAGPFGDYYLSHTAAGQMVDSPCIDAGSDTAANLGMDQFTTRIDGIIDMGPVNMGYHYFGDHLLPDISGDWLVNFTDYAILAADWLLCLDPCDSNSLPGDLTRVQCATYEDIGALADSWLRCYVGLAWSPYPKNNTIYVDPKTILSWSAGDGAVSHDVYLGTDLSEVESAGITDANVHMGNQDGNTWDTNNFNGCCLDFNTTYYWRIDEIGPARAVKGNIWSFTTHSHDANLALVGRWQLD